jgi:hypothetical protein
MIPRLEPGRKIAATTKRDLASAEFCSDVDHVI